MVKTYTTHCTHWNITKHYKINMHFLNTQIYDISSFFRLRFSPLSKNNWRRNSITSSICPSKRQIWIAELRKFIFFSWEFPFRSLNFCLMFRTYFVTQLDLFSFSNCVYHWNSIRFNYGYLLKYYWSRIQIVAIITFVKCNSIAKLRNFFHLLRQFHCI